VALAASLVAAGAVGATVAGAYAGAAGQQDQVRAVVAEPVAESFAVHAPMPTLMASHAVTAREDHTATPAPSAAPQATSRPTAAPVHHAAATHHPDATPHATHHAAATQHPKATPHPTETPHHGGHDGGGHDGGHE
jgi:hypothetical protein